MNVNKDEEQLRDMIYTPLLLITIKLS